MCLYIKQDRIPPNYGLATNRINTKVRIWSDAGRNMISRPLRNAEFPLKRAAQIVRMHLSPCRCVSMSRLRAHTQARSYRYTPKSLRWLQLGATIKTVVAFFFFFSTVLKRIQSDWSRHIQSRGHVLFHKGGRDLRSVIIAESARRACVVPLFVRARRPDDRVIITRGRASFRNKLFPS